jgi:hypothetical protein
MSKRGEVHTMSEQPPVLSRGFVIWAALAVGLALALLAGAGISGCGNVADVGVGAGQSSVTPVSGPYGYGTSTYTSSQLLDRDKQVATAAEDNRRSDSKAAVAANKTIKAEADQDDGATPDVTPETAEAAEPALKAAVVTQEQGLSPSPAPVSGGYGPSY